MNLEFSQAWIALLGTIFGGAGFKIIEHWLSRNQRTDDTATKLRDELREEVKSLREELRKVEADLDTWRGKYYELMEQFLAVRADLETALRTIKTSAAEAEETLKDQP